MWQDSTRKRRLRSSLKEEEQHYDVSRTSSNTGIVPRNVWAFHLGPRSHAWFQNTFLNYLYYGSVVIAVNACHHSVQIDRLHNRNTRRDKTVD
jgi:hypothetical protein